MAAASFNLPRPVFSLMCHSTNNQKRTPRDDIHKLKQQDAQFSYPALDGVGSRLRRRLAGIEQWFRDLLDCQQLVHIRPVDVVARRRRKRRAKNAMAVEDETAPSLAQSLEVKEYQRNGVDRN